MKRSLIALHAAFVILAGCSGKWDGIDLPTGSVAVSVHGVNYTDDPFDYGIAEPNSDAKRGVGEHISPFSAGGIVCCFNIPKKWKPGIRMKVFTSYWVKDEQHPDGHDIEKTEIVELPPYADGKAGELWVMRTAGGGLEVVSSDFQPDHPQWPGKVKGWPEPSLKFQRERWVLFYHEAVDHLEYYRDLLRKLDEEPEKTFEEQWVAEKHVDSKKVEMFSGPDDQLYRKHVEKESLDLATYWHERVETMVKEKP